MASSVIDFSVVDSVSASFSVNFFYGFAGDTISFYDLSTGDPTFWYWSFGDGNFSTDQNPTNTYSSSGVYDVTLYVSNGASYDEVTYSNYIVIIEDECMHHYKKIAC